VTGAVIKSVTGAVIKSRSSRLRRRRGWRQDRGPDRTLARLFARFALTGLAAMVVIGAIAFVVIRSSPKAFPTR
jgi:hypothetical protein